LHEKHRAEQKDQNYKRETQIKVMFFRLEMMNLMLIQALIGKIQLKKSAEFVPPQQHGFKKKMNLLMK
jgi:hypothetical protein